MRRVSHHDAVKAAATLKQAKWEQMGGWKDCATVSGAPAAMQTRRAPHLELIHKRRTPYFERNSPFKKHEKAIKHGALHRELTKTTKTKATGGKTTKAFSPEVSTGMSSGEFYLFYFRSQRKALLRAIKKASGHPRPGTDRNQRKDLLRAIEKAAGYANSNRRKSKLAQRLSRLDAMMTKNEGFHTNPVKDRKASTTETFNFTEEISTKANRETTSPQDSQIRAISGQVMAMRSLLIQLLAKLSPAEELGQWIDASSVESSTNEKVPDDWIDVNPQM